MPHSHITLETLIKQGIQFVNLKAINLSELYATNCLSLDPQSLSRLLTKFEESYCQEYEILQSPGLSFPKYELILPGTEIPKLFNHQSFGNSISFWVGQDFPAILLCIVFGLEEHIGNRFVPAFHLRLIIKCREKTVDILANVIDGKGESDHLWVSFVPYGEFHETFDDLNLYDQNEVEIVFKTASTYDPPKITPTIKRCGVHTKCICPQTFGESNLHHQCHSANPLQPLLPLFPSSTKITNHGIDSNLRGLNGDDSDVIECQPPLVPDDARHLLFPSTVGLQLDMINGSDLGLGRLVFESTISDGTSSSALSRAFDVRQ
ncbi:hypothetical protein CMV_012425 [Castanea mollissima]|uniref:Uncharacterized protein n=1 Tax=Castanea mollissima TaxID=60419 RepID=A0A8J4RI43_9ROSI|nr:hypothetical protein CMV_012425 [Castanea mollissima]